MKKHWYWLGFLPGVAVLAGASVHATITYYKDVLPILQEHCLSCHQPNQLAPISFLTYQETRPWAEAMKQAVTTRTMPPSWAGQMGSPGLEDHGGLTAREVDCIASWVEQGSVAGDPRDAPPPLYFDLATRVRTPQARAAANAPSSFEDLR